MIICVSLLYFFGNSVDSFASILELFGFDIYNDMPLYTITANVFLFSSHGLPIFIFYSFDKEHNRMFQRLILRRQRPLSIADSTEAVDSSVAINKQTPSRENPYRP